MITGTAPEKIPRKYAGMFAVGAPDHYPAGAAPEGPPPPMGGEGGPEGGPPMGGPAAAKKKPSFPSVHIKDGITGVKQPGNLTGTMQDSSAKGIAIKVIDDGFTGGIYAEGSQFALENSQIDLSGNGISLGGPGSGVCADHGSDFVIRNCRIETNGSARCATSAENGSTLRVYDSQLISHGAPFGSELPPGAFMATPPAALEIDGNCRTHVTMGNSFSYFYNSTISADGWAALSTDISNGWVYLEANDCNVITVNSGYGVYSDGGCHGVLNRCNVKVASMAAIAAGESDVTFRDCNADCGTYFALIHCIGMPVEVTEMDVIGGTVHCKSPAVLLKSANARITFENVDLVSDSGILIKSIVNDDPNAGNVIAPAEPVYGIRATLKDMKVSGDVLHGDCQARPLYLSLKGTRLSGKIQNAWLSMDADSSWYATGDSLVGADGGLSPDKIDAPTGVTVTVFGNTDEENEYTLKSGGKLIVATPRESL